MVVKLRCSGGVQGLDNLISQLESSLLRQMRFATRVEMRFSEVAQGAQLGSKGN